MAKLLFLLRCPVRFQGSTINMAEAVILSKDTFDRLMKMLEKWEKGDIIMPGLGLKIEEQGTGYQKLGVDGTECPQ